MSGVAVTKSSPVVIVPSETETAPPLAAGDTVRLSPFDKCVAPFPVTLLLAFDRPIDEPVGTLRTALSRALAHYRPIAGRRRLAARPGDDGEEPCIACTDEGVTFVAASAACALAEFTTAQLSDLVLRYPGDFCRNDEPLLLVQVTEFSCGGFVLGVTFNHVAADGAGIAQFLGSVSELARGPAPSVVPVREWDDSLPGLPEPMVASQKSTMTHGRLALARLDVTVPWAVVDRVRAESPGGTAFEAVAAVLWQCRTRAVLVSPDDDPAADSPAPLAFPSDVRGQVGATAGYYGNCVVVQMVPATSHAVASGGVGDLVALIRRAREKVPNLLVSSKGGGGGGTAAAADQGEQPELGYNALVVVSWRKLGFEAVDFGGGGGPARVTWHEERTVVPGCVVCPPCRGEDDGVSVAAICVKPEHADAFVRELVAMGVRVAPSNLCA